MDDFRITEGGTMKANVGKNSRYVGVIMPNILGESIDTTSELFNVSKPDLMRFIMDLGLRLIIEDERPPIEKARMIRGYQADMAYKQVESQYKEYRRELARNMLSELDGVFEMPTDKKTRKTRTLQK